MTGLIDCNNFFVSCERVFNPKLRERPVAVLSNNDGCIVALSNEAKNIGLKRGDPYFKVKDYCERNGVAVLSGNHRLYGDMSSRVMAVLGSMAPEIEIYSIDEAFMNLNGFDPEKVADYGREIVSRIRRATGIPTSLGISSTKTLAKVAAGFAKRYKGYRSVCTITNDIARRKALALTEIGGVWGVGRRLRKRFAGTGICNALQFADMPEEKVAHLVNISGQRTWRELNGIPCLEIEMVEPSRKQMCCSRSFGTMLTDFEQLQQAVALFSTIVSRKLRERHLAAVSLSVFIHTNAFRDDLEQYFNSAHRTFPEATNDTLTISSMATECLRSVYRKGYRYKKAGVLVHEIVDEEAIKRSLFENQESRERRQRLMEVLDKLNSEYKSSEAVHIASYRPIERLAKGERRSRLYSTNFSDIITVNCNNRL